MSHTARTWSRLVAPATAVAVALTLAGCGGEGGDTEAVDEPAPVATEDTPAAEDVTTDLEEMAEDMAEDLEEMAEDMAEDLEARQDAAGGGSATLTAGDQTWTFDGALCGFGEEENGQEGAEFVLSSIQDGLQFYVSIDTFGHMISINDIEDFENPSVSLSSDGSAGEFITLAGKNVSGQTTMVGDDGTGAVEASFEGTCP